MRRRLSQELLDTLPPDDRSAIRSRRDLVRINALMGNARMISEAIKDATPIRVLDLGAGDGRAALGWVRRLSREEGCVTLLDREPVVPKSVRNGFSALGWTCDVIKADVFEYFRSAESRWDAIVSNLFIHHFENNDLYELLSILSKRCELFVACEPARTRFALAGTWGLGAIGCNAVTRHDARVSVEAGFRGRELSDLWPSEPGWKMQERDVFPFSHLFVATRAG